MPPTSASAAPFGELPFRPVDGIATCVRATGAPGELTRWAPGGVELLHADRTGLTPDETIPLGRSTTCPLVVSQPNGAAVAATLSTSLHASRLTVALRDPGGRFRQPVSLRAGPGLAAELDSIAVAVSPRGDAVVGVTQLDFRRRRGRVLAFVRHPGGTFAPPQAVTGWRASARAR